MLMAQLDKTGKYWMVYVTDGHTPVEQAKTVYAVEEMLIFKVPLWREFIYQLCRFFNVESKLPVNFRHGLPPAISKDGWSPINSEA